MRVKVERPDVSVKCSTCDYRELTAGSGQMSVSSVRPYVGGVTGRNLKSLKPIKASLIEHFKYLLFPNRPTDQKNWNTVHWPD